MFEFPWAYQKIEPTTWTYVSSLLMLALFFKFSRIWSVRNLDLILIILLAPGLLLYDHGTTMEREAVAKIKELGENASLSLTSGGMLEKQVLATVNSPSGEEETASSEEAKDPENEDEEKTPSDSESVPTAQPDSDNRPSDTSTPDTSASDTGETNGGSAGQEAEKIESAGENPDQDSEERPAGPMQDEFSTDSPGSSQTEPAAETETDESEGQPATDSDDNDDDDKDAEAAPTETLSSSTLDHQGQLEYWRGRQALSHILLYTSFLFLLSVAGLFVIRLLLDQVLVRRPLLENNMTVGGLSFLVASFLTFLVANILISSPMQNDLYGAQTAATVLGDGDVSDLEVAQPEMGPAYPLIHLLPVIPTVIRDNGITPSVSGTEKSEQRSQGLVWVAKLVAILSQFAIVAGLIVLGRMHFSSMQNGVGMATLYLMLPYTAQMAGRVDHVLPGALLIWAAVLYRRPYWAGILFGMTMGLVYYPLFLLALWISFYWDKGAARFVYGVITMIVLLILSLFFFSTEDQGFLANLQGMFGVWLPRVSGLKGIWEFGWDPAFRLPILAAFVSLCVSFVAWPIRKTYGTLLAYSAAMMVAVQFWHGYEGGLFMAWYMPLTIAAFFRPNVHERIAKNDVY